MAKKDEKIGGLGGGNPSDYKDMARDLFNRQAKQGAGKQVDERASYGSPGNPKSYLDMARDLRPKLDN